MSELRWAAIMWAFFVPTCGAQQMGPSLQNGRIFYTSAEGAVKEVDVGGPCRDLWVAPDRSLITFVGVDESKPPSGREISPFVVRSSVYVARRDEQYRPVRHEVNVRLYKRIWQVAELPKIAPDHTTLYYLVPSSMTSSTLMRAGLTGRDIETVHDVIGYCVVWGGDHAGDLIVLVRKWPKGTPVEVGVRQSCSVWDPQGRETMLADDCSDRYDALAEEWSKKHGGTCP